VAIFSSLVSPGGKVPAYGEIHTNRDLASTLKKLVAAEDMAKKQGKSRSLALQAVRDRFYKGDLAEAIVSFQKTFQCKDDTGQKHTGLLTAEDFATYTAKLREPWTVKFMVMTFINAAPGPRDLCSFRH